MYDLPDSTIGALRSCRFGIGLCLVLLLIGSLLGAWFGIAAEDIKEDLQNEATALVDEVYDGRESNALHAGIRAWAQANQAHGHAIGFGSMGLLLMILMVILGCKGRLAFGVCLAYGIGAIAYSVHWLLVGFGAPSAGGVDAARGSWGWLGHGGAALLLAALLVMLALIAWRLLRVPLPGRDDLSTFVEL